MIRINLLPAGLEPETTHVFNPVYPLVGFGALVGVLLFVNYHKQTNLRDKQRDEIASANTKIKQLEPVIQQVETLEAQKSQLNQKKGVIQSIENERLRYPLLMDDVVRLLPGNIWLNSLVTSIGVNFMTVTMQVSALDNYALADLISNLESSQIFTDTELGPVASTSSPGTGQTLNFQITTNYQKMNLGTNAIKNRNLIISLVGLALIAIASYVFWSYAIVPVERDQQADATKLAELRAKLKTAQERAGQLDQIQLEMASLQIDVAQLEKQLPKDRELPALIRVLSHRAEANGVQIVSFAPSKPVPKGLYDEIPYSLNIISSFHNLGHFLTAMGKGERLFAARNLAMTANNSKTDPSKTITATFNLIAFKYHE